MRLHGILAFAILLAGAAGSTAAPDASFEDAIKTPFAAIQKAASKQPGVKAAAFDQRRGPGDWRREPDWGRDGRGRGPGDRWPGDRWPGDGRGGGYRREACYGFDRGWEEHWGGHGGFNFSPQEACRACKNPTGPHGSCTFRCGVEATQCKAEFVRRDGTTGGFDYEGRPSDNRWDAEDNALSRCRNENWNDRDGGQCRIKRCDQVQETTRSGGC
ncbi:MAG: hypothetical protein HY925_09270 [Elusimicrobia bacterium]|nr:hypothetical protein [Elusimicrobiota bacterium]